MFVCDFQIGVFDAEPGDHFFWLGNAPDNEEVPFNWCLAAHGGGLGINEVGVWLQMMGGEEGPWGVFMLLRREHLKGGVDCDKSACWRRDRR